MSPEQRPYSERIHDHKTQPSLQAGMSPEQRRAHVALHLSEGDGSLQQRIAADDARVLAAIMGQNVPRPEASGAPPATAPPPAGSDARMRAAMEAGDIAQRLAESDARLRAAIDGGDAAHHS